MHLLAAAIFVLALVEVAGIIYLGGRMADGTKALADFNQFLVDLLATSKAQAQAFADLLTAIKNNNGINPGAIETLIGQGEALVKTMNDGIAAAEAAIAPPPPPPAVSVSVIPTSASLALGASQQFSASVSNAPDTSVKWTNSGSGSVDQNGLYTAPTTAGNDVVTATSNADPTKSSSASVTIA